MKRLALYSLAFAISIALLVVFALISSVVIHPIGKKSIVREGGRNSVVETYVPETSSSTSEELEVVSTMIVPEKPRMIRDPKQLPGERAVRVPILMYHYVRPFSAVLTRSQRLLTVTPEHFDNQMQEIVENGYHTISPDDLYHALNDGARLPPKPVLITFDDGYRGQYTYAYPSLVKRNLRATFFIISTYTNLNGYMNTEMMKEMDASGLMTLASHTRHHAPLTKIARDTQIDEIFGSKEDMEKEYGHPVDYFAYPYGYLNEQVKQLTTEAGYRLGFSTILGSLHTSSSRMELRRIRVQDGERLAPLLERYSK